MNKGWIILFRVVARLIDLFVLYVGFGLFYSWMNRDNPMAYDRLFNGLIEIKYYLPFCIIYVPLLESITCGFTVGKFICRIRVRKLSGELITPKEAVLRSLASVIDFTLTLGLAAIISATTSTKGQRLGDRLAKTIVTKVK
jgi:uncharacterized RDD family membrane protein YckC